VIDPLTDKKIDEAVGRTSPDSYAPYDRTAFDGECRTLHDFGGSYGSLDNRRHPAPPEGLSWMCPDHGDITGRLERKA
jgi:hypothetical protein